MKQAAKTNSRASVASYAVCLTALALILMVSSLLASQVPGAAAPAPPSAVGHKGGDAKPAASAKSYEGLSAHQTTGWGVYDTKACPAGIRIQAQTGTVLVATPPDWTVYLFRKGQKKAAKLSYAMFRTKNRFALKLSDIREKPRTIKVAGNKAISYTFEVNKRLDETTMYRSRQAQPIVLRKEVVFASETNFIPKQAKEIWRSYFESPVVEEIPLQTILYMMNGEKRVPMETITFKRETMTAADFRVPPGLSYTAQFVEMIYGKEMEGAADLLLEP